MNAELERDGFSVARGVLARQDCVRLASLCDHLAAALGDADRRAHISTGSLIRTWSEPAFARLIAAPELLDLLGPRARFSNGYVLVKPPRSPALFWHQDWWAWNEPISYGARAPQIGLLLYPRGADRESGCLRVIPGSHRRATSLAERAGLVPIAQLRRAEHPDLPEHQGATGELDLPLGEGDVVLLDARVFHASHANDADHARPAITLWYFPDYEALPETLRATIGTQDVPAAWPDDARALVAPLLPRYTGTLAPSPYRLEPDVTRMLTAYADSARTLEDIEVVGGR